MSKAQQEGGRVWDGRKGVGEGVPGTEKGYRRRQESRVAVPAQGSWSEGREPRWFQFASREKQHDTHFGI